MVHERHEAPDTWSIASRPRKDPGSPDPHTFRSLSLSVPVPSPKFALGLSPQVRKRACSSPIAF